MGRNLREALYQRPGAQHDTFALIDVRSPEAELRAAARVADFVFHLAGVNRPEDPADFMHGNGGFTETLLAMLEEGKRPPVLLSSSTQAATQNPYGESKRAAEQAVRDYGLRSGVPVLIYRMTNAFGKWSRPNYNSAVATFCHNIARGLPISLSDPEAMLRLNYIDDICAEFIRALNGHPTREGDFCAVHPVHEIKLGDLSALLNTFHSGRDALDVPFVALRIEAALPLLCQRSLETFTFPVELEQMLGLIREESDEAALPPGHEPYLLPQDARIVPAELVEDELILAVPVVPAAPGTEAMEREWRPAGEEAGAGNPFAALASLKAGKD